MSTFCGVDAKLKHMDNCNRKDGEGLDALAREGTLNGVDPKL